MVITGMSVVSCFGNNYDDFYDRCVDKHSGWSITVNSAAYIMDICV